MGKSNDQKKNTKKKPPDTALCGISQRSRSLSGPACPFFAVGNRFINFGQTVSLRKVRNSEMNRDGSVVTACGCEQMQIPLRHFFFPPSSPTSLHFQVTRLSIDNA